MRSFRPVILSSQDLRDIYAALDDLTPYRTRPDEGVKIEVNEEYRADTIDDVLNIEDDLSHLRMTSVNGWVYLRVSVWAAVVYWSARSTTPGREVDQVVEQLCAVLAAREEPRQSRWGFWLPPIIAAVGGVGGVALNALLQVWFSETTSLAVSIPVQLVSILVSMSMVVRRALARRKGSILRFQRERVEPFHRRFNVEIMLILTALAVIVPVVTLLVD